jgi:hypothetical protein
MTKSFTGVAIMQLVEKGDWTWRIPFLNIWIVADTWQNITIKQMPRIPQEFLIFGRPEHMWSDDSAELFKKIKEQAIVFQPEKN